MKPSLTRIVGVAVIVLVIIAAAWYARGRATEPGSSGDPLCESLLVARSVPAPSNVRRVEPTLEPPTGWELVEVHSELDPSVMWAYVNDYLNAPDGERIEAVEQPEVALDVVVTSRSQDPDRRLQRTRQVILPDKAWVEDATTARRAQCQRDPDEVPADVIIHAPLKGWGLERVGLLDTPDPLVRPPRAARRIGERPQNGENLPLYEMLPPENAPHLRSVFAVDSERNLRFHEITDTRTGEVVLHRHADPVPDHPPIADPTGQPVISAG